MRLRGRERAGELQRGKKEGVGAREALGHSRKRKRKG